ncbi:intracellular hyaluronan-binding protein 4-like [Diabrotica undecimpunctata]|uniref:intracellular hyaluronan-binding protein 4-like n=1 Tax=Diabrotica undecimpunctata TaxID=50387 RepID=UPI003B63A78D
MTLGCYNLLGRKGLTLGFSSHSTAPQYSRPSFSPYSTLMRDRGTAISKVLVVWKSWVQELQHDILSRSKQFISQKIPAPRNNVDGKPERSFNRFNNENREERNNRRNREDRPYNGPSENRDREERPRREPATGDFENRNNRDRGERREGREGREGRAIGNRPGAPRGQRRNFDGDRRGKREFDRQSGSDKTGVQPIGKRDGAGAHNWGSHKDVIEEADRPNNDANESWGDEVKIDPIETEKKEEVEVEQTPVEEEPKELTLDEWKAQRAGRAKPQFNIRKAGEGEDPSQWKKMFELRKKEKDEEDTDEEEYDALEYPQRVGRQKHLLDIEIQFNDSVRRGGGRGRGQRSGCPRGGGNRGGSSGGGGGGGGNRAPKVDGERDFPSLG